MQNSKPRLNLDLNRDYIPALVTPAGYDIQTLVAIPGRGFFKNNVKHLKVRQQLIN